MARRRRNVSNNKHVADIALNRNGLSVPLWFGWLIAIVVAVGMALMIYGLG